jgi:CoA:oxalate CoA-transferase
MLVEVEQAGIGKVKVAGNPIKLSSVPSEAELPDLPAPQIGEHTKEILMKMLGYSEADAERYLKENC